MRSFLPLLLITLTTACSGSEDAQTPSSDASTDSAVVDTGAADAADTATDASDAPAEETAADAPADTATDTFTCEVGMLCNDTQPCPGSLRCYGVPGKDGFCAPMEPECGGFAMTMCKDGRACLRASGSSLGYCATALEMTCICDKPDAGKIDGC